MIASSASIIFIGGVLLCRFDARISLSGTIHNGSGHDFIVHPPNLASITAEYGLIHIPTDNEHLQMITLFILLDPTAEKWPRGYRRRAMSNNCQRSGCLLVYRDEWLVG